MTIPRPMTDPCRRCPKAAKCQSAETYKCDLFRAIFIRSWNETVAFLKAQLNKECNHDQNPR